jgi:hypothetical protein
VFSGEGGFMSVDAADFVRHHREGLVSHTRATKTVRSGSLFKNFLLLILLLAACTVGFMVFLLDGEIQNFGKSGSTNGLGVSANNSVPPAVSGSNGKAVPQIFSDTAMVSGVFSSFATCKAKIKSSLSAVKAKKNVLFKIDQRNIAYLRFEGPSNNYIIRCFDVANKYRIFISGSSASVNMLNQEMKLLYDVIERG